MKLYKQLAASFISVAMIAATGLISIPFLTRQLTPEKMGKFFFLLVIISVLQIFEGLKPVITFKLNEKVLNNEQYIRIFSDVNYIFIILGSILLFILFLFLDLSYIETILLLLCFLFFSLMSVQWAILETYRYIEFTSIFRALGWVFAYSLFILFSYIGLSIEYYSVAILSMYISVYIVFRYKSLKRTKLRHKKCDSRKFPLYKSHFKDIFFKSVSNIKIQFFAISLVSMDKFIVPFITGYELFGFYAVQSELVSKSYVINATVRRVFYPYFSEETNKGKLSIYISHVFFLFIASLLFVIILGFYGENIIGLYAGAEYTDYCYIFKILLLVFPLNIIGSFGVIILHVNGDFELHNRLCKYAAIFSALSIGILSYFNGIIGAAIGLLLSRTIDILLYFKAINKHLKKTNIYIATIITALYFFIGFAISISNYILVFILFFMLVSLSFLVILKHD